MILRAEHLIKKYKSRTVVKDVSVQVEQGEIVGLLGPNGAGKTTSFYMIVGLITPNGGRIFLDDQEITKEPVYKRAQLGVGYLAQEASVFRRLSVEDKIRAVLDDRFCFEVRHAAQHGQEFRLDGFGVLRPGPNGTIAFAYEPRPVQSAADAAPGAASVPAGTQTAPMGQKPPKLPYSEPRVSPSAKMNPDPSVRGLRYGKPPKTTAAYTYVDRPPRRRRADRFIWVAAIAAAIAVAAIAFGYLREANDKEAEMQYLEQPADPQPATDTGAATPEQPITE